MEMNLSAIKSKETIPGYRGKMVHSKNMTLAFWEVEQGAAAPEHFHSNEQIMHVLEGTFEFTLGGVTRTCHAGDIVIIGANIPHGGRAITPCRLLDVFSPAREDYK
jgi:quercetin dioxygenase-like cupin family protein